MVPVANLTSAATNVGSEIIEKYSIAEKSDFCELIIRDFQYFEWLKSCPSTHSTRRISLSVPEQSPIRDFDFSLFAPTFIYSSLFFLFRHLAVSGFGGRGAGRGAGSGTR